MRSVGSRTDKHTRLGKSAVGETHPPQIPKSHMDGEETHHKGQYSRTKVPLHGVGRAVAANLTRPEREARKVGQNGGLRTRTDLNGGEIMIR